MVDVSLRSGWVCDTSPSQEDQGMPMVACPDDAQRLVRTIPSRSGEPFESDSTSEHVSKRSGDKDKLPDDA